MRKSGKRGGKYKWTYLGKTLTSAKNRLRDFEKDDQALNRFFAEIEDKVAKAKKESTNRTLKPHQKSITVKLIDF
ncbi:MAG: hypothetical protein ACXAEU_16055 [Candidatus Hodarchaeales archaeon]